MIDKRVWAVGAAIICNMTAIFQLTLGYSDAAPVFYGISVGFGIVYVAECLAFRRAARLLPAEPDHG